MLELHINESMMLRELKNMRTSLPDFMAMPLSDIGTQFLQSRRKKRPNKKKGPSEEKVSQENQDIIVNTE